MSSRALLVLRCVFALALVPLAIGVLNVTYQDAAMTHLPGKWATVEMARAGTLPFLQPYASFGQPLAGNPNFGTFFPDTLLFLALPLRVAFGAHFALAAALAFIGARRWARAEGVEPAPAEVAAFAFVLSGVFVSTWKFYNSGMALAVAPWVMAASARVARGTAPRRAAGSLAVAGALEVLAGEPVVALLTFVLAGARVLATVVAVRPPARPRLGALVLGLTLAGLLAAPQILLTWQILHGSSRERRPFPFVTASGTSVHPMLALEQVLPFPFGRPDLTGPAGFTGHEWFDNHSPYLWSLHLGWATLALLILFGRARTGPERGYYAVAVLGMVLSLGKYLPLAKKMYPLLSLDGRIRFPVKWWYVVALCVVPAVGWAAQRWQEREKPNRGSPAVAATMLVAFLAVAVVHGALSVLAWWGVVASAIAVGALLLRRGGVSAVALAVAAPLALGHLPLLLAVLDRPLPAPAALTGGRVYERIRDADAHPPGSPAQAETATRAVFRRVPSELWAVNGALSGIPYAFDRDPDGSYSDDDRAVRKELDDASWEERADRLRRSGVRYVVTDEVLGPPYREGAVLSAAHQVRLYSLDDPAPAVRMDDGRVVSFEEGPSTLTAEVDAGDGGTLVWSRSYFSAWKAAVDGRYVEPVMADGHLVGIPLSAGAHHVAVRWSRAPLLAGVALFGVGVVAVLALRRSPMPSAA